MNNTHKRCLPGESEGKDRSRSVSVFFGGKISDNKCIEMKGAHKGLKGTSVSAIDLVKMFRLCKKVGIFMRK